MEKATHYFIPKRSPWITLSLTIEGLLLNLRSIRCSVERTGAVQNNYVGLWIRIQHRFGPRFSEWVMSGHMVGTAFVFLYVDDLFSREAYTMFIQLFRDEQYVGWVLFVLGLSRVIGLVVNGARPNVTPAIRQISAGIGFMIWLGVSYCFWKSGVMGLWLSTYPVFAVTELVNFYRAAHDHGEVNGGRNS